MNLLVFFAEAFSEGSVILPNIIFAGLFFNHFGSYDYLLPFVLLYSFEKAGPFAIQGFGRIRNPYRILKLFLPIAVLGSIVTLFGYKSHILWSIGASLIGIGLSIFMPFYKTVKDELKENGRWKYKNSTIKGYLTLGILTVVYMIVRRVNINYVFLIFTFVLFGVLYFVINLDVPDKFKNDRMFKPHNLGLRYFIPSVLIFLLTLAARSLKQTSNTEFLIYMLMLFCIFILSDIFFKKRSYRVHSLQSVWYGAVRNFFTIYSLIYFTAIGKYDYVAISYSMIALALVLAKAASVIVTKRISGYVYEVFCIIMAMISSLLILIPKMYMAGILLGCMFVAMGNSSAVKAYLKDNSFVKYERRLVKSRFYSFGSVLQQVFLLSSLIVLSKLLLDNANIAIYSYALYSADMGLKNVFWWTGALCIVSIWIFGIFIIHKTFTKKN